MCGFTEIDGYAFASGLDFFDKASADIITQVALLIQGAVFRSRNIKPTQELLSLNICPLGELLDMYHAQKATVVHDKVYALLGMCSDDLSTAQLEPDYTLEWSILMERLVKVILGNHVSVSSWEKKEMAVITTKGCILGKVSKVEASVGRAGGQTVEAIFTNTPKHLRHKGNGRACWTLPNSAKLIQKGDLICLFQGASKPSIVRLHEDYFTVIKIAASPPKELQTEDGPVSWSELSHLVHFVRNFLLVWNWNLSSRTFQDPKKCDEMMQTNGFQLDAETGLSGQLSTATRIWRVALILGDLGEYQKEEDKLRVAVEGYERAIGEEHRDTLERLHRLTPLLWATKYGQGAIVQLLLTQDDVDINLKDPQFDRTPLSWAAEDGQDGIVMQLLATENVDVNAKDKYGRTALLYAAVSGSDTVVRLLLDRNVDVDAKDIYSRTPLSYAASYGYKTIVQLLREVSEDKFDVRSNNKKNGKSQLALAAKSGHVGVVKKLLLEAKADVETKDKPYARTPLSWAANNGHEAVVKLLLEAKADVEAKDRPYARTPLSWAANNGHEAVVKLLLEAKADVEAKEKFDRTPLSWAAENGHEAVVKLLLEANADVEAKNLKGQTPLLWAAKSRYEAIVKLLLEAKADVEAKNLDGQTPLLWAAINRYEAGVKLLLKAKADVETKDRLGWTPLLWAVKNGHEAIFKLLLEARADVEAKNLDGQTPLSWAAENRYEAGVKLLLGVRANVEAKNLDGQTPLLWAAKSGYEAVVKLLLEAEADVETKDRLGWTPLLLAARNGYKAVVKLLLEAKADVETEDRFGWTPLSWAANNGHEAVVKLLK
jgi:ankyrin repeat protein